MDNLGDFRFLEEDAGKMEKPKGHKKTSLAGSLTPPTLKDWRDEEEERKVEESVGKETDDNLFDLLSRQENDSKEKKRSIGSSENFVEWQDATIERKRRGAREGPRGSRKKNRQFLGLTLEPRERE